MGAYHTPVLLQAACDLLEVKKNGLYIDATFGGGGHAAEITRRGGKVLGLDQDAEALVPALASAETNSNITKIKGNFMFLDSIAKAHSFYPVDGVLFDLGVSSHQLEAPSRGFSFLREGPLDMRMDQSSPVTARDLVNTLPLPRLVKIFAEFGELNHASHISQKIISARPLKTTTDLARLFPQPKTRQLVFQALRIAVNAELDALKEALPQAFGLLRPGGVLVVISFHSLEDRIVKDQFNNWASLGLGQVLTPKPITPQLQEIEANSKAKSSKLRALKKHV